MVDISDVFPPVVQGWEAFGEFARATKSDWRYFRTGIGEKFIEQILDSSANRITEMPQGTQLWRARLGAVSERVVLAQTDDGGSDIWTEEDRPYPPYEMRPLQNNWKSEGRVNPRGISYIYLAKNDRTALAEVRPWMGSKVSVGKFELRRHVRLIDCSKYHDSTIIDLKDVGGTFEDGVWLAIDKAFAKPVARDDDIADYVPTQAVAEAFKAHGYDGVVYKSLLEKDGYNVALFYRDDVRIMSCDLVQITGVHFAYRDRRCGYDLDDCCYSDSSRLS